MSEQNRGNVLNTIVVLALCAVFFLLAIGITLLGSNTYQNIVASSDENYEHRTSLSFVVNQLRRNDSGTIYIGTFDGQQTLMLFEDEGDPYATLLYCYDGWLMELYTEAEFLSEFRAEDGIPVMALENLSFTLDGTLITIVADGQRVTISPRCHVEEVGAL